MIDERTFLPVGTVIGDGRFEIEKHAGAGGFGLTYRARDRKRANVHVAIKEYFPAGYAKRTATGVVFGPETPLNASPQVIAYSEALSTDRVSHPSVPNTIFTFRDHGTAYIAMDWVEGETLRDLAQRGGVTPAVLLKVYLTALDAVLHFAKEGIAHRDLNPNNIMIRADGEPIVVDFGLARAVGPDFTTMTRTVAFASGFEPPEQWNSRGWQEVWTDIYTLSASMFFVATGYRASRERPGTLLELLRQNRTLVHGLEEGFAACVDRGLELSIPDRLRSGAEALETLGIGKSELAGILHPKVFENTLLLEGPEPLRYAMGPNVRPQRDGDRLPPVFRYQKSLLQSFDTARFQPTSLKCLDGSELTTALAGKIALARTEAALNLLFGREIVVPAGQVAESPAFMAIFMEIMTPFLRDYADRIASACKNAGLPPFRPFRLALESREMIDYEGFVRKYEFTGAPLVLIRSAGGDGGARQKETAARIDGFKALFLSKQYDKLEQAVKQPGYAEFARMVDTWFRPETSVFARGDIPEVSANEYSQMFFSRLNDDTLIGAGVSEARASLELVEEIEASLREAGVAGYRGNWYLFSERFADVWPLARAYLDTRLFLTLARQYEIDHPVFISQEFEYGRFDHSLILGPRAAANLVSDDESHLLQVASHFTEPVDWSVVLELFLNDKYLRSIRRLNRHYFARTPENDENYVEDIQTHGQLLSQLLGDLFSFEMENDRLSVRSIGTEGGVSMSYEAYDPTGLSAALRKKDRTVTESLFGNAKIPDMEYTAAKTLRTDANGGAVFGDVVASSVLHYFAKPYRTFVDRSR